MGLFLGNPPSLHWLGFNAPPEELVPGDKFTLTFYWQALRDLLPSGRVRFEFTDSTGVTVQKAEFPIGLNYPPGLWKEGEAVTDRYDIVLRRDILSGIYELIVEINLGEHSVRRKIGIVRVKSWTRVFEKPTVENETDIYFGNLFRLIGYEFPRETLVGSIGINLCWHALKELSVSYKIFIHLLDLKGSIISQVDSVPGYGKYPTSGWLPGEYICSVYELPLPTELPQGIYSVVIGAYDPEFEERLPLYDKEGNSLGDSFKLVELRLPLR